MVQTQVADCLDFDDDDDDDDFVVADWHVAWSKTKALMADWQMNHAPHNAKAIKTYLTTN